MTWELRLPSSSLVAGTTNDPYACAERHLSGFQGPGYSKRLLAFGDSRSTYHAYSIRLRGRVCALQCFGESKGSGGPGRRGGGCVCVDIGSRASWAVLLVSLHVLQRLVKSFLLPLLPTSSSSFLLVHGHFPIFREKIQTWRLVCVRGRDYINNNNNNKQKQVTLKSVKVTNQGAFLGGKSVAEVFYYSGLCQKSIWLTLSLPWSLVKLPFAL